jgi:hypothetical protein
MKKRITMVGVLVLGFVVLSVLSIAGSRQIAQKEILKSDALKNLRPDVLIESIDFASTQEGKMVTLKVTGWIANDSTLNSWCCPTEAGKAAWAAQPSANSLFEWKKYVRSYPNGSWTQLGGAVGTMLKAHERQNYNFTDTLPVGTQREYKIVLDTGNWLQESDKNNNTKTRVFSSGK